MLPDVLPVCVPPSDGRERRRARAGSRSTIREMMTLARSDDPSALQVRREQLSEMLRSTPFSLTASAGTALLVTIAMSRQAAAPGLWWWFAAMVAHVLFRGARAARLHRQIKAGVTVPGGFCELTLVTAILGCLWLVPVFLWFGHVDETGQMFVTLVIIGMMSGGSTTLAAVPPASIAFVAILGVALIRITLFLDSWIMTALAVNLALVLCNSVLSGARLFIHHVRARRELEEQGELIKLLREFQSSGSDWLWELDGEQRIHYMSRGMAESIGRPVEVLIGRSLRALVDPKGDYQPLSSGIRSLFAHLDQGSAFHEIAFPTVDGQRWYSLSGRPVLDEDGAVVGWRGVGSDITDFRSGPGTEGVRVARRDLLTGLGNRLMVREMIEEARLRQLRGQGPASSCCSTSTVSRWSTTRSGIPSAIACWSKWRGALKLHAVQTPGSGGSGATNLLWCGADRRIR